MTATRSMDKWSFSCPSLHDTYRTNYIYIYFFGGEVRLERKPRRDGGRCKRKQLQYDRVLRRRCIPKRKTWGLPKKFLPGAIILPAPDRKVRM